MIISARTGLSGFFLSSLLVISGCSSSSSTDDLTTQDDVSSEVPGTVVPGTEVPTTEVPTTGTDGSTVMDDDGTGTDVISETPDTSATPGSPVSIPGENVQPDSTLPDAVANGSDASGGEDDSVAAVETASLAGPFVKDTSRSAGPPSIPTDLTLLLSAENWLEFSWAPSSDDQSVEAYEVYRDGTLIATVRGDTGYPHDYRSWLSTSFIDCNYTRYTDCIGDRTPIPGASYSYSVVAVDNEGMKSEPSTPALFTFEELTSEAPDLAGYVRVFDEEFEGTELDRAKWKTALPWGPDITINDELQYFVNVFGSDPIDYTPFEFTGQTMKITGKETPPELLAAANNKPYLSGVITTSDNFEMTYGYVEMSAKLAGGEGLLSTFYLFNQDYFKNKPEIDIVEYIGARADKSYQTYHYYDSNRTRDPSGEKHSSPTMETVVGEDLSTGFHKYSAMWEPGLVVWYIDDQEVRRMTGVRVSDEPMNIIAQLVVGSSWIGEPGAGVIPAELEIDYIRAWQK